MPALALPRGHALCGGLEKLGGCLGGVVQSLKQSSTNRTSPTKIRDVPAKNTTPCPIPPAPVRHAKWLRHKPATIISNQMTSPTTRRHFDRPCFLFIGSPSVCTRDKCACASPTARPASPDQQSGDHCRRCRGACGRSGRLGPCAEAKRSRDPRELRGRGPWLTPTALRGGPAATRTPERCPRVGTLAGRRPKRDQGYARERGA